LLEYYCIVLSPLSEDVNCFYFACQFQWHSHE